MPDQGRTPFLSTFWMPLDEFTRITMEGLISGKPEVPVGVVAQAFEKYERGKREQLEEGFKIMGK